MHHNFTTKQTNPTQTAVDSIPCLTRDLATPEFEPPKIDLAQCCRRCECDWGWLGLNFQIFCLACEKPLRWADPEIWLLRSDLWSCDLIREGALK